MVESSLDELEELDELEVGVGVGVASDVGVVVGVEVGVDELDSLTDSFFLVSIVDIPVELPLVSCTEIALAAATAPPLSNPSPRTEPAAMTAHFFLASMMSSIHLVEARSLVRPPLVIFILSTPHEVGW